MIEPYYKDEYATIYHGDCREVLPLLDGGFVLVSDPPYGVSLGIAKDTRKGRHGLGKAAYDIYNDTVDEWVQLVPPVIESLLAKAKRAAVFSGPHFQELPKCDALGGVYCPSGVGRHRWGFNTFMPILFYGTAPNLNKGAKPITFYSSDVAEQNGHPCPKPLSWMKRVISVAADKGDVIVDPFMGSGTTLRAAKDLGLKSIGIEISERYCEIAARRLAQEVLPLAAG